MNTKSTIGHDVGLEEEFMYKKKIKLGMFFRQSTVYMPNKEAQKSFIIFRIELYAYRVEKNVPKISPQNEI